MKNKKIQIKMFKKQSKEEKLINSIDYESLLLFREMMAGRFKKYDKNKMAAGRYGGGRARPFFYDFFFKICIYFC